MQNEEPLFHHDGCEKCVFLGSHNEHDLYFCPQDGHWPTVIARFGSEESDYKSGLHFASFDSELGEAKRRAIEKGLLPDPTAEIVNG